MEFLYDLGFTKEDIEYFSEVSSSEDYYYVLNNQDKIIKVYNAFLKNGVKKAKMLLIEKTYVFYESPEYIEEKLSKTPDLVDKLNESIDEIDMLFAF